MENWCLHWLFSFSHCPCSPS
ncbi:hypothetical protein Goklo_016939 [Gossypium klotzschianum]|uniref:Uncharacterized protein n=1 Tax=Gossypium klotzschianum TaxID=34286 RepID=A0A7J8UGG4_9ROSI|nr:hypothetical protein [Gossypium klotzschianum]